MGGSAQLSRRAEVSLSGPVSWVPRPQPAWAPLAGRPGYRWLRKRLSESLCFWGAASLPVPWHGVGGGVGTMASSEARGLACVAPAGPVLDAGRFPHCTHVPRPDPLC